MVLIEPAERYTASPGFGKQDRIIIGRSRNQESLENQRDFSSKRLKVIEKSMNSKDNQVNTKESASPEARNDLEILYKIIRE